MRYSNSQFFLAVLFPVLVTGIIGCAPNPYKQLLRNDYYVYVLPDSLLEEQGWQLKPIEQDWVAHCKGGASAPWNPLDIHYLDQEGKPHLSLNISNRNVIWDRQYPTEEIVLNSPWIKDGVGMKYKDDEMSPIKFIDTFGNEVVVSSSLTFTEIVILVNQLEYIGVPPDEALNPWSVEWCEAHSN